MIPYKKFIFLVLFLSFPAIHLSAQQVEIVGGKSPCTYFLVGKSQQTRFKDGEISGAVEKGRGKSKKIIKVKSRQSSLPSVDWQKLDFDDSMWLSGTTPFRTGRQRGFSLVCARWRFMIDDLAAVKDLTLSLKYRGGVVVYLNGKEIGRNHMPKGSVTPDTPAEDYPKDAYLDPDGYVLRVGWQDPQKYKDRFALRRRSHSVTITKGQLAKGVNVLAIEAHRPLTDMAYFTGSPRRYKKSVYCPWETLALNEVTLSAPTPASSSKRPKLSLWNAAPLQKLNADRLGDSNAAVRPVVMYGCKNGSFVGVIMTGSTDPIMKLKAKITDLKGSQGTVSQSELDLKYGEARGVGARKTTPWFDSLEPDPPEEVKLIKGAACLPIWITARVSSDVKPGKYNGKLTVSAEGAAPVDVPVELQVSDWTLPSVTDSASWWWVVQSPETLSIAYGVKMWSPEHLKLIGTSFDLLREIGTRIVYVPLFRNSHMGNDRSMVRWIKQDDGTWKCDF